MHRQILVACLPYLLAIGVSILMLRVLVLLSGARLRLRQLKRLHRDQLGGVQSLSFVLTLPLFMMIMMFIVQVSQITIARVAVEYSAFAAARSAIVWIPAHTGMLGEEENKIGSLIDLGEVPDQAGWRRYGVEPYGWKYSKIHLAAAQACMPICPSRDLYQSYDHPGNAAADALRVAYFSLAPSQQSNSRLIARLRNKLAYALENTRVFVEIRHNEAHDPWLADQWGGPYGISYDEAGDKELEYSEIGLPDYEAEFAYNEIGFQDQVLVTVMHEFALLPGPGRLLARRLQPAEAFFFGGPSSGYSNDITLDYRNRRVYTYGMTATVRMTAEGEKSRVPYIHSP